MLIRHSSRIKHGRCLHTVRNRLSNVFLPSGNVTLKSVENSGLGHELLLKAGYIRQSTAGIYSLLPLGVRVMERLERRIDHYMSLLGASKISLPNLAPRRIWEQTGRWESSGRELFKIQDRKDAEFCLAPTHEEVVTKMVAADVNGYRQLPVRVYQIGRKFRDERRPRGGLLRGKEFVMKDLYTFDDGVEKAHATYRDVSDVYKAFFESLGVPYHVAEADSGNIGGDLSHEYHLPSKIGEDTLLTCSSCQYVANQEVASYIKTGPRKLRFGHQVYRDSVFFETSIPAGKSLNMTQFTKRAQALDESLTTLIPIAPQEGQTSRYHSGHTTTHTIEDPPIQIEQDDPCPRCSGPLKEVKAIEIGHTFHLGTKYSTPLNFKYSNQQNQSVAPEMGCHGIGVSRLLAALAELKHDDHGLNWPEGMAPYDTAIVVDSGFEAIADKVYDSLTGHRVIDDRMGKSIAYKVKDMHLMGIPRVLVIGKHFHKLNQTPGQITVEQADRGQQQREFSRVVL